ncbi:G-rich sequence factor 1-like isoform X5 [Heptranchias perlo]|uniref:G-rich sequence factor 1-like isoform X5 n=1 Tax=Heptranchias perlo TaxID=212740 RepID=UPI00355A4B28
MAVSCRVGVFLNLRALSRAYSYSAAGSFRPCFPLVSVKEPQARSWASALSKVRTVLHPRYSHQETSHPFRDEEYPPLPDYDPTPLEMEGNTVFVVRARGLPWSCSAEDVLGFFSVFELSSSDVDTLLKRLHSSEKELTDGSVVRLRGLPFSCTAEEINRFFEGLQIVEDGITITKDHRGRNTGDAFVQFASQEIAEQALAKDREMIGSRYIEIFRSTKNDLRLYIRPSKKLPRCPTVQEIVTDDESCNVVNSNSDNGEMTEGEDRVQSVVQLSKNDLESNHCVQRFEVHNVHMRGLPFRVNGQDVVKFFQPLRPVRIIVEYGPDGKATGEADVHFATHEDAVAAMTKDKSHMRKHITQSGKSELQCLWEHRYIELYLNSSCSGITAGHNDQGSQEKGSEES